MFVDVLRSVHIARVRHSWQCAWVPLDSAPEDDRQRGLGECKQTAEGVGGGWLMVRRRELRASAARAALVQASREAASPGRQKLEQSPGLAEAPGACGDCAARGQAGHRHHDRLQRRVRHSTTECQVRRKGPIHNHAPSS
jgi:hypothetical protein